MKIRSDIELLQIMLDKIKWTWSGLCNLMAQLYDKGIITSSEYNRLFYLIHKHKPYGSGNNTAYYWEQGLLEPRIEFLNQLIIKLKSDE